MGSPKKPTKAFRVSFGAEDFFLDRDLETARKWPDRNVIMIDGSDIEEHELVSICERTWDQANTVIVDDAHKVKGDKFLKAYADKVTPTDLSTILVAIVRSEKLPAVWSHVSRKGECFEHKKFKPWEQSEIITWLHKEAGTLDVLLADGVPELLLPACGLNLYKLNNELRKLALYLGPGKTVTKDHLKLIVSSAPSSDQFQVADATLAKDPKRAMNALTIFYKNEGDDCLVPVVNALMKQCERALMVRRMLDRGVSEADMAISVGMKPFPFRINVLPNVRKHEGRDLVRHMGRLCKLDADVKGAARSKRTLVELAVLSIAG